MQYVSSIRTRSLASPSRCCVLTWVLLRRMPFNNVTLLQDNIVYVTRALGMPITIKDAAEYTDEKGKQPKPGVPVIVFT